MFDRTRLQTFPVLILLATLALGAACGAEGATRSAEGRAPDDGRTPATTTPPRQPASAFPRDVEGCAVLTSAEAAALMGTAVQQSEETEPGAPVTLEGAFSGTYSGHGCEHIGPELEPDGGFLQPRASLAIDPEPGQLGSLTGESCSEVAATVLGRVGRITQCGGPNVEDFTVFSLVDGYPVQLEVRRLPRGGIDDVAAAAKRIFEQLDAMAGTSR